MKKDEGNLRGAMEDCANSEDWRSPSFRCIIDSIQDIFESYASLDDPAVEPDDYFGLTIDALKETLLDDDVDDKESKSADETPEDIPSAAESFLPEERESPICMPPPPPVFAEPTGLASTNSSNVSIKTPDTTTPTDTKPKRPLSAYNLFFQLERERLIAGIDPDTPFTAEDVERVAINRRLQEQGERPKRKHRKSHGKISFAELARKIANKWKTLDPDAKDLLQERAAIEKARYLRELEAWTTTNNENQRAEFVKKLASTNPEFAALPTPQPSQSGDGSYHANPNYYHHQGHVQEDYGHQHCHTWNTQPAMSSPCPQYTSSFDNYHGATVTPGSSFDSCDQPQSDQSRRDPSYLEYEAYNMAERTGWNPSAIMHMMNELDTAQHHGSQQQQCQQQHPYGSPHRQMEYAQYPPMEAKSLGTAQESQHYAHHAPIAAHGVSNGEW